MKKYVRAAICVAFGMFKFFFTKLFHPKWFRGPLISVISPNTEISLDYGGKLTIGAWFKMRGGAKLRVRNGAECVIGDRTSMNCNCMITCHEKILIGNDVQFSPNVQIYDHDHDYRAGLENQQYQTAPVTIGNQVWIGANTVILRGTAIGDHCVIGAGSVLKGVYPDHSLIIQKRETTVHPISVERSEACEQPI